NDARSATGQRGPVQPDQLAGSLPESQGSLKVQLYLRDPMALHRPTPARAQGLQPHCSRAWRVADRDIQPCSDSSCVDSQSARAASWVDGRSTTGISAPDDGL